MVYKEEHLDGVHEYDRYIQNAYSQSKTQARHFSAVEEGVGNQSWHEVGKLKHADASMGLKKYYQHHRFLNTRTTSASGFCCGELQVLSLPGKSQSLFRQGSDCLQASNNIAMQGKQ